MQRKLTEREMDMADDGYSGEEVRVTPMGTLVIIRSIGTIGAQNVLGSDAQKLLLFPSAQRLRGDVNSSVIDWCWRGERERESCHTIVDHAKMAAPGTGLEREREAESRQREKLRIR